MPEVTIVLNNPRDRRLQLVGQALIGLLAGKNLSGGPLQICQAEAMARDALLLADAVLALEEK